MQKPTSERQGEVDGSLTRVRMPDGRLLVAAICPVGVDQGEGAWRASFIFDSLHLVHRGFWSQEEARRDAEETLTGYLQQQGLVSVAASSTEFDQQVEEMLAPLAVILDEGWQVAHMSEHPEMWVAVCINDARTALLVLAFTREFRELGPQDLLDHSVRYRLDQQPPTDPTSTHSLSIAAEIKRSIATLLLAKQVSFSMRPLTERLYQVTVPVGDLALLQGKIEEHVASGLVDDDGELAWFRYKGALISYTRASPTYISQRHYRYETDGMSGPMELDMRDLSTLRALPENHKAAIMAAVDSGELHPGAPFLKKPFSEEWEEIS